MPGSSNGTLTYEWYEDDWEPGTDAKPIATGATVEIMATKETFENNLLLFFVTLPKYCVVVTNTYIDSDGITQTISIKSDPVSVMLVGNVFTTMAAPWKSLYKEIGIGGIIFASPFLTIISLFSLIGTPLFYLIALMTERQV